MKTILPIALLAASVSAPFTAAIYGLQEEKGRQPIAIDWRAQARQEAASLGTTIETLKEISTTELAVVQEHVEKLDQDTLAKMTKLVAMEDASIQPDFHEEIQARIEGGLSHEEEVVEQHLKVLVFYDAWLSGGAADFYESMGIADPPLVGSEAMSDQMTHSMMASVIAASFLRHQRGIRRLAKEQQWRLDLAGR